VALAFIFWLFIAWLKTICSLKQRMLVESQISGNETKSHTIFYDCKLNSKDLVSRFTKLQLACFFLEVFNNVWYANYPHHHIKLHKAFMKKFLEMSWIFDWRHSNLLT
jgi:hypothetical protein